MEENEFGNVKIHNGLGTKFATKCIICDEFVPINEYETLGVCIKVCQRCKDAIKYAKTLNETKGGKQI